MKYPVRRRKGEQGFALLLVFVMAAAIALMLYQQMPRVAFESERDKEQLLIDRGGQYQRAIQVYYATFKRYPARIEDLENTNDKRFLRRRYVDPFTGKDEWRIIHTNGLFLTDSKVQKPPAAANANGTNQTAGTGTAPGGIGGAAPGGIGSTLGGTNISSTSGNGNTTNPTDPNAAANGTADPNAPPPPVNALVAARPSDRTLPTNQSYSNPTAPGVTSQANQNQNLNQNPPNFNDPIAYPPISLYPNGYNAPQPGQPGAQANGNQPGQPGLNQGVGINQPGQNQLGLNQQGLNQQGLTQQGQQGLNQALNPLNLNQQGLPNTGQPNGLTGGIIGAPGIPNGIQQNTIQQGLQQQGLIPPGQQFQNQPVPGQQFQGQQFQGQQFQGQPQGTVQVPGQLPQGGAPGAPGSNPGLNMIQQLLTTPRAPPPGIGPATTDQSTGAAIAGVASKFTGPSIKSYGGRTDYSEWEFVFQPQQQQIMPPVQQNGQNGQQQTGTQPNTQTGGGFGTGTGLGPSPMGGPSPLPSTPH